MKLTDIVSPKYCSEALSMPAEIRHTFVAEQASRLLSLIASVSPFSALWKTMSKGFLSVGKGAGNLPGGRSRYGH